MNLFRAKSLWRDCRFISGCPALPSRTARWMVELELLWEPRDLWVGVFWKSYPGALEFYVCLLPLLPVRIYWLSFANPNRSK